MNPGKNRKAHSYRGTTQRLSYITSCLCFTIKAFQSLGPAVCTGRKRPAHYVRFDGISSITWTESKLMNSSLCVKRSDASIQSNWGFFLCSVRLHHWGNKPSASHFSNKVRKLAISLPQRHKDSKHHIYTPWHSAGRTLEKIHLIIHICIMFYIGPSVVASELLLFFFF